MVLSIEKSGTGKQCLVVGSYKYREAHTLTNGDVSWRCLGRECAASVRTNSERSAILKHKDIHSGKHPQTYRNVLLTPPTRQNSSSETTSPYSSLEPSPLVSHVLNKLRLVERYSQTDDDCLKSKDELLDRIAELTCRQSALIDKIQELQLQLEVKESKLTTTKTMTVDTGVGCDSVCCQDKTVQTDLVAVVPVANDCKQCINEKQSARYFEDFNFHTQMELAAVNSKYDDLLRSHEELLRAQGKKKRHDDSLVNRKLTLSATENRYGVLGQLSELESSLCDEAQGTKDKPYIVTKTRKGKNKKKVRSKTKTDEMRKTGKDISLLASQNKENRSKLYVFGDSHANNLYELLKKNAKPQTDIFVYSSPNGDTDYILQTVKTMVSHLTSEDTAVLIVGTNDLAGITPRHRRPAHVLPGKLLRFVRANDHVNWQLVTLPNRNDLPWNHFINRETRLVNDNLSQICKENPVKLIDTRQLYRHSYTRHGLHLNRGGKEVLCDLILGALRGDSRMAGTARRSAPDAGGRGRVKAAVVAPRVSSGRCVARAPDLRSCAAFPPLRVVSPVANAQESDGGTITYADALIQTCTQQSTSLEEEVLTTASMFKTNFVNGSSFLGSPSPRVGQN